MSTISLEPRTTRCSTAHCLNRAEVRPIGLRGEWWRPILNPAPFCATCIARAASR